MPLKPGKRNIGHNIDAEMKAGKDHKQALAIALNVARKAKKYASGGEVASSKAPMKYSREDDVKHSMADEILKKRQMVSEEIEHQDDEDSPEFSELLMDYADSNEDEVEDDDSPVTSVADKIRQKMKRKS